MEFLSASVVLQAIVNGLLLGLIYTAMAMGLSLTMGIMRVVNVAHSTFVILGAFLAFELLNRFGLDPIVSTIGSIPVFFIIGALLEKALIRRVVRAPETVGLLILFGVLVIIESASILIWTTDPRVISVSYTATSLFIGDIALSKTRLIGGAMALIVVSLTHFFLQHTLMGKGIRAMAQSRDAAMMMGINVERLSMIVFGMGTATAAAGGVTLAMIFAFAPQDHIKWLAWAFLVVIVGGLGNVRNTLIAGLFIGLLEALSGVLLPFQYVYLVLYSSLALALLVRGQGLAGARTRTL